MRTFLIAKLKFATLRHARYFQDGCRHPTRIRGTEMYWYCGIFHYERNLACNFLSVKSPYQLSRGLKLMSLLVTCTGCMLMYQPMKKHLTAKHRSMNCSQLVEGSQLLYSVCEAEASQCRNKK
ncbi:uncharacterized protein LOC124329229 [Daphnia pulicaria]|uniref:uncharacterized protein LOC124329229 n=1 Tax=Daphnia pulicaria TaxID=35523 RepID=UPI001EEC3547|nr:uncharacterized protein LOC124329229 [Daphnia pulicaria]